MPDSIVQATLREIEPLRTEEPVSGAVKRLIDLELPALPVVDEEGGYAGIFGEREFLEALFPGYVGTLTTSAAISRSIDKTIERRETCGEEPVADHLTKDHVLVEDDFSDTQLAEIFLHHRVLIVPIATGGRVHAVVTRADFFRSLAERFLDRTDGA